MSIRIVYVGKNERLVMINTEQINQIAFFVSFIVRRTWSPVILNISVKSEQYSYIEKRPSIRIYNTNFEEYRENGNEEIDLCTTE